MFAFLFVQTVYGFFNRSGKKLSAQILTLINILTYRNNPSYISMAILILLTVRSNTTPKVSLTVTRVSVY